MGQKTSALNITGSNSKVVAKEVFNSFYELTKEKPTNETVKTVSAEDRDFYLALPFSEITRTFLTVTFADTVDSTSKHVGGKHKAKYNTWDKITVPENNLYQGQPQIETTVGRYITNKFVLQGSGIIEYTGYINTTIDSKGLSKIDEIVGQLYLEDKIDRPKYNSYTDRRDTLGYWANGMLAHTISEKMLKPLPEIEKKKAELIKKYQKELDEHNVDVMTKIADELTAYAEDLLKDDPGMDLYKSGDLNFSNNYRNNAIVKGAVLNKLTDEFDFISTSFMDGMEIKDLPAHANSILASQYPASISTAESGYMGKKLLALLQMMQVDEPDTDCGTKRLIPIKVTKTNKDNLIYSYIDDGSGVLKMLTKEEVDSYVGKTIKMRSPMTCIGTKICSKCAGKLFEMLGIKDAGLFGVQVSHSDLNLGLKQKHISNVVLSTLDPDNLIEDL